MPLLPAQREGTFPHSSIAVPHAPVPHGQVVTSSGEETDTPVTFEALYAEFNAKYAEPLRIMRFTSRRVTRHYAFDQSDVPQESEYLQVVYSAEYPAPPMDASGRTFSRVFGTTTSRSSPLPSHPSPPLTSSPSFLTSPSPLTFSFSPLTPSPSPQLPSVHPLIFSHSLEQLVLSCQLRGPCWLHITQPSEWRCEVVLM